MPNHGLQCGVLVLQRPLGHHLLLVMVHRQSIRHLLYVLPQRGDGLPDEQQDYQPAQYWLAESWQESLTHKASSPKTQIPS